MLISMLEELSWVTGTIVCMALFIIMTIALILLVRRFVNLKSLKAHHDVAGFVYANLGVLYAVLLGFTVVNVQQRFDKFKGTVQEEASLLDTLYREAEVLSNTDKNNIRNAIKIYLEDVIQKEWISMEQGIAIPNITQAFENIWKAYSSAQVSNVKQQIWYSDSLRSLNQIMNIRMARLAGIEDSLGGEMWTMLLLGGILMASFICFFGLENLYSHLLMASILAGTTAFLLFLIFSLDTVFSGDVSIPPKAYIKVLETVLKQ